MKKRRETVIMVDDNITNLNVVRNALIDKYDIFTVPSGKKLFQILERTTPDLILLDIDMPEMSGYEVIEKLKSMENTAHIPVIFLTAMIDTECELAGLSLGAVDYITKPFPAQLLEKRVEIHLLLESQKKTLKNYNDNLESLVKEKTQTVLELQNAVLMTVAELVEFRDDITGGHIERTTEYLKILVNALLEYSEYRDTVLSWDIDLLLLSAQLHDVGKIAIRDGVLLKPGRLTDEEFEEIKQHAAYGVSILKRIEQNTSNSAFLNQAKILAGSHHEKWDGSGYPSGLKGEQIPLQGRLMAIVDVYDALTNERPYKRAFTHEESVDIIRKESGKHFDPRLVEVFLRHNRQFKRIGAELCLCVPV